MADRKEKETVKGGVVAGTVSGCPVLIQTGPNVKVLAQVRLGILCSVNENSLKSVIIID